MAKLVTFDSDRAPLLFPSSPPFLLPLCLLLLLMGLEILLFPYLNQSFPLLVAVV